MLLKHLIIISQSKRPEDREFYLRMTAQQRWGSEVVEYALSRTPAMVAEYKTQLPDKKLLAAKLHEFHALNVAHAESALDAEPKSSNPEHLKDFGRV